MWDKSSLGKKNKLRNLLEKYQSDSTETHEVGNLLQITEVLNGIFQ